MCSVDGIGLNCKLQSVKVDLDYCNAYAEIEINSIGVECVDNDDSVVAEQENFDLPATCDVVVLGGTTSVFSKSFGYLR